MEVNGVVDTRRLDYRTMLRYMAEVFDAGRLLSSDPAYQAEPPTSVADAAHWLAAAYPDEPPCGFDAAAVRQRIDAVMAEEMAGYSASLLRADTALSNWDGSQQHFNAEFRAPNVWEVDIPLEVIAEAKEVFRAAGLAEAFHSLHRSNARYLQVSAAEERFFALRALGGGMGGGMGGKMGGGMGGAPSSDITWISVDGQSTFARFERLFGRLGLSSGFDRIVDPSERLTMYSAFYVVRSRCDAPFFHFDWPEAMGVKALTLMTPLAEYRTRSSFNLLYAPLPASPLPTSPDAAGESEQSSGPPQLSDEGGRMWGAEALDASARYEYRMGKGIIFGASFAHSTEPGSAHEQDGLHAYLCFTFGTDRPKHWPGVAESIGGQSRVVGAMDGSLVRTRLGEEIAREIEEAEVTIGRLASS